MSTLRLTPVKPAGQALVVEIVGDIQDAGGVGGWSAIERPLREAAAEWTGLPERIQTIPIAIDGRGTSARAHRSVEAECRRLESWCQPTTETGEPPVLRLTGPVYGAGRRWVIDDLQKGSQILNDAGKRISMDYVLVVRQYLAPVVLRSPAKKARAKRKDRD